MTFKTGILGLIWAAGLAAQTTTGSGTSAESGTGAAAAFPTNITPGAWTLVQHTMFSTSGSSGSGSCAAGTATCTVNVTAIGAGHLLVCFPHGISAAANACSGDGDTWSTCCATANGTLNIGLSYVLSSTGGATSITCNFASTSTYKECGLREYSLSNGSPVSDSGGTGLQGGCTTCNGDSVSVAGSNEVIVQSIFPSTSTVSVTGGYGNLDVSTAATGGGIADMLNTTNGNASNIWTLSAAGNVAVNGLGFMTSFGLLAPVGPGPRARAPARRAARRAVRRRRRRREEREEKRDDRDERREDRN